MFRGSSEHPQALQYVNSYDDVERHGYANMHESIEMRSKASYHLEPMKEPCCCQYKHDKVQRQSRSQIWKELWWSPNLLREVN